MSYLVLARRWRPQKFEEVIGQEHVSRTLVNALTSNRLAHGFLFSGTRGVGKTSVARILAKAINCLGPLETAPCNECRSCLEINEDRSVDVQEIDGASNNGVEQVRELRENARYLPASSKSKVYIIDEVHMLSKGAFNALLKTLEEPPSHVVFIFATTEVHKVPATILSRCQRYDFRPIPAGPIAAHLLDITGRENIALDEGAAKILARAARGSMRDALSLLDQTISFAGNTIGEQEVQDILGMVDPRLVWNLAGAVLAGDGAAVLAGIEAVAQSGHDWWTVYTELMTLFRNLIVLKVDPVTAVESLGLSEAEAAELGAQATQASAESLQLCLEGLLGAERMLRSTASPRFSLELALLKICRLTPLTSLSDIIVSLSQAAENLEPSRAEARNDVQTEAPDHPSPGQSRPDRSPAPASPTRRAKARESAPAGEEDPEPASGTEDPDGAKAPGLGLDPVADWSSFRKFLRRRDALTATMLNHAKPKSLNQGRLSLVSKKTNGLLDGERLNKISRLATAFFGRPLELTIAAAPARSGPTGGAGRQDLEKKAFEDPLIKQAMDTFGVKSISVQRPKK